MAITKTNPSHATKIVTLSSMRAFAGVLLHGTILIIKASPFAVVYANPRRIPSTSALPFLQQNHGRNQQQATGQRQRNSQQSHQTHFHQRRET
jgi:hypothetical protein